VDEFSNFFNIFCRFAGVGRPERSSSSTDTQLTFKNPGVLKEFSPKASRSISRVLVADLPSFKQNLKQTHCSILPSITNRTKHEVEKALV
jgi:hypothetical protein